jgi:hypothetical protein
VQILFYYSYFYSHENVLGILCERVILSVLCISCYNLGMLIDIGRIFQICLNHHFYVRTIVFCIVFCVVNEILRLEFSNSLVINLVSFSNVRKFGPLNFLCIVSF